MALFGLRFDFRNPPFAGTTMAERYAAGAGHGRVGRPSSARSPSSSPSTTARSDGYLP